MGNEESFYDVFERKCASPLFVGHYVTENQKASIRINAKFLNQLRRDDYEKVAFDIVTTIGIYNTATDSLHTEVKHKHPQREKDIRYTEKFLSIFLNGDRKIIATNKSPEEWHKEIHILYELANNFLELIKDEKKTYYCSIKHSSKTKLKEVMNSIVKTYHLKVTTREVKKFIDNFDNPFND